MASSERNIAKARSDWIRCVAFALGCDDAELLGSVLLLRHQVWGTRSSASNKVAMLPRVMLEPRGLILGEGMTAFLLLASGPLPKAVAGDTLLHLASRHGKVQCVKALLACGACSLRALNEHGARAQQVATTECSAAFDEAVAARRISFSENKERDTQEITAAERRPARDMPPGTEAFDRLDNSLTYKNVPLELQDAAELRRQAREGARQPHGELQATRTTSLLSRISLDSVVDSVAELSLDSILTLLNPTGHEEGAASVVTASAAPQLWPRNSKWYSHFTAATQRRPLLPRGASGAMPWNLHSEVWVKDTTLLGDSVPCWARMEAQLTFEGGIGVLRLSHTLLGKPYPGRDPGLPTREIRLRGTGHERISVPVKGTSRHDKQFRLQYDMEGNDNIELRFEHKAQAREWLDAVVSAIAHAHKYRTERVTAILAAEKAKQQQTPKAWQGAHKRAVYSAGHPTNDVASNKDVPHSDENCAGDAEVPVTYVTPEATTRELAKKAKGSPLSSHHDTFEIRAFSGGRKRSNPKSIADGIKATVSKLSGTQASNAEEEATKPSKADTPTQSRCRTWSRTSIVETIGGITDTLQDADEMLRCCSRELIAGKGVSPSLISSPRHDAEVPSSDPGEFKLGQS